MALKGCNCNDATCRVCVNAQVRAERLTARLRAETKRRIDEYNQSMDAQSDTQLPAEVTPGPLKDPEEVCGDCPPIGYPTDKTRCAPCPRRVTPEQETPFDNERADMKYREDMKDAGRGHLLR